MAPPPTFEQQDNLWRECIALERRAMRCHTAKVRLYRGRGPTQRQLGTAQLIPPPPPIALTPAEAASSPTSRFAAVKANEAPCAGRSDAYARVFSVRDASAPVSRQGALSALPTVVRPRSATTTRTSPSRNGPSRRSTSSASRYRPASSSTSLERRVETMGAQLEQQTHALEHFQHEMAAMASLLRELKSVILSGPTSPAANRAV
jgi:hypothetical protein